MFLKNVYHEIDVMLVFLGCFCMQSTNFFCNFYIRVQTLSVKKLTSNPEKQKKQIKFYEIDFSFFEGFFVIQCIT